MISIIVPVYNAEDTLDEALMSLVQFGVEGQEIILVDDGSSDGSWAKIAQFQLKNRNVVALRHEGNRGGGAARNTGVRVATHPLLFILDSDDVLASSGVLGRAVAMMQDRNLDGIATGRSSFFEADPRQVLFQVTYPSRLGTFRDVISGNPSPITGNLLFRKSAFDRAGGYPDYHSFDTQAFGFRLLANNAQIQIMEEILYYQRRPARPSYYTRERSRGNSGRNWYYILSECLYKFEESVRREILSFDYGDPIGLAKGADLFHILSRRIDAGGLSEEGLGFDDAQAYSAYDRSPDPTLQIWCAIMDLRNGNLDGYMGRLDSLRDEPLARRALYLVLARWSNGRLSEHDISELRYFFGRDKGRVWRFQHTIQRVRNRMARAFK